MCMPIFMLFIWVTRIYRNIRDTLKNTLKMSSFTDPCATPLNYTSQLVWLISKWIS